VTDDVTGPIRTERAPGRAAVAFPVVDGRRSTAATGRAVVADAVRAVDPALADDVLATANWRAGYLDAFARMTALAATRPGAAASISADGLAAVHRRFVVTGPDGDPARDRPLAAVLAEGPVDGDPGLRTVTVTGSAPFARAELSVPYHGSRLAGAALDRRLDAWVSGGIAEESLATALRLVRDNPEWLDLRDLTVVVLGAGAEMGPLVSLARWGAHVVAVDLPRPDLWQRVLATVRASPGRLSVPVSRPLPASATDGDLAAAAGADVLTAAPALLDWLTRIEGPYTLGNYVYTDGARYVLASVAIDALTMELTRRRPEVSLAFLATPTDAFAVPPEVVEDTARRFARRSPAARLAHLASAGRLCRPNYPARLVLPDGRPAGLTDALVPQQGPNYALAKRIQRWRALHDRAAGRLVSLNIAPATRTRSVVRNRLLAAAYAGAGRFGVEVFEPSTSNTLMAALLVHDLRNPAAPARPEVPLGHPLELFWQAANHGGLWRTPYAPRSVLGVAVVLGMVQRSA
jgi:hypothetical protein